MARYQVSRCTAFRWQEEYRESIGLTRPASPSKPLGVPPGAPVPPEYESMERPELIKELMRRDIEVARLKKGYAVKGGGPRKEYVTSSDSNTR